MILKLSCIRRISDAALLLVATLLLASCVHQFPEPEETMPVRLVINHELTWTEKEFNYTRSRAGADKPYARYVIRAYRKGDIKIPLYEFLRTAPEVTEKPFETTLQLPPGEWDLYIWQDMALPSRLMHDVSDFARISHTQPYIGNSDSRDAFEGDVSVSVSSSYEAGYHASAEVTLQRPVAKYIFITTDFNEFYEDVLLPAHQKATGYTIAKKPWAMLSQPEKKQLLEGYSVTAYYPLFMPTVYSMFEHKAISSERGRKYEATVEPINDREAYVSMDYVFMNHRESSALVQLVLHTPTGQNLTMTPTVEVPLKRKQVTYVRGKFLTSGVGGGIDIDFGFSGDNNIEI